MKRKYLSLIAALGLSLYSGQKSFAQHPPSLDAPIKYVNKLVSNTSVDYRTAVKQTESQGIFQIKELLNKEEVEEVWAYLPKKREWIEIGYAEKPEEKIVIKNQVFYNTEVKLDTSFLEKLMKENNEITVWHYSPNGSQMLEDKIKTAEDEGKPLTEQEISKIKNYISVCEAIPSEFDLINMISNSQKFNEINPDGKLLYKLCSKTGVTEFYLTNKGKEFFKDKGGIAVICFGVTTGFFSRFFYPQFESENNQGKINKLCDSVISAGEDVNAKYASHSERVTNRFLTEMSLIIYFILSCLGLR